MTCSREVGHHCSSKFMFSSILTIDDKHYQYIVLFDILFLINKCNKTLALPNSLKVINILGLSSR